MAEVSSNSDISECAYYISHNPILNASLNSHTRFSTYVEIFIFYTHDCPSNRCLHPPHHFRVTSHLVCIAISLQAIFPSTFSP